LAGDDWLVQGYPRPGAGSTLPRFENRSGFDTDEGTHYIVNGPKDMDHAGSAREHDLSASCARKTVKQQEGISFLPECAWNPRVEVRPDHSCSTAPTRWNDSLFTDAEKLPFENLVGKEERR